MIRIEIILDQIIEDIFLEGLGKRRGFDKFTLVSPVKGCGFQEPKMGDHVWPGENSLFIIYTADENRDFFVELVEKIRHGYPRNGIAMFITPGGEEV